MRRDLLTFTALKVLQEAGSPLPKREVLGRMTQELQGKLNSWESSETPRGPRWQVQISWDVMGAISAGWMTRDKAGWLITREGRAALEEFPDGTGMVAATDRAYAEDHDMNQTGHYARVLTAALDILEPGEWTTYSDLAELGNTNAQTAGSFVRDSHHDAAYRVLTKSGRPSPRFQWLDPERAESQREALEAEGIQFSDSGLAARDTYRGAADLRPVLEEADVLPRPAQRAWYVRTHQSNEAKGWQTALTTNSIAVDWPIPGEVPDPADRNEMHVIVEEARPEASYAARRAWAEDGYAVLRSMRPGDLVLMRADGWRVGTVKDGPVELRTTSLTRRVEWSATSFPDSALTETDSIQTSGSRVLVDITRMLPELTALMSDDAGAEKPVLAKRSLLSPVTSELALQLSLDEAWLNELVELLLYRPQLILHGPPGTGKTYVAMHLAEHLAGQENVQLVQFHPAYSYEDFFEGFRPTAQGKFELRPGPLRRIVERARQDSDTPYFLVIDEINRGNLAKIFGELYFLLEYRDRSIDLMYSSGADEQSFTLPRNLFIIGTMNTADRSIALVDAAMRRRFSFVSMHPDVEPTKSLLRTWLRREELPSKGAELWEELNRRIDDDNHKIGPSFLLNRSAHEDRTVMQRVWRTQILPLLEEYYFASGVNVEERFGYTTLINQVTHAVSSPDPTS